MIFSFKDWSFRTKLMVPLLVLAAVFIASFGSTFWSTITLSKRILVTAEESLPSLDLVLQADRDLYQALVAERSLMEVDPDSEAFTSFRDSQAENIAQANERISKFGELTRNVEMKRSVSEFLVRHQEWSAIALQIPTIYERDTALATLEAKELSFSLAAEKFDIMREILDRITDPLQEIAHEYAQDSVEIAEASETQQVITLVICLAICFTLIVFFPGLITKPISKMLDGISEVTKEADFTYRLPVDSRDEIGRLSEVFNQLLAAMESAIDECNTLVSEIAQGQFGRTLTTDSKGHLERLVKGINDTSTAVNLAMTDINTITSELATGDFEAHKTNVLPGGFGNTLNNATQAKIAVRSVIEATNNALTKIADGDFTHAIEEDFPGELEGLKTGVNHTLLSLEKVFSSIESMMDALRAGNFTKRSDTQLKGQFADMVSLVEQSMAQMNLAMQDISGVMSNVVDGQLGARVSAEMSGDLESLKQHINHSLNQIETLNSIVCNILSSFANGDLTKSINENFPGDYVQLKDDVNRTILNLKDMIGGIQTSSDEVLLASEQLQQGSADISKRTEQQAAALEETMGALESIRESGQQSKATVEQVIGVCKQTVREAAEGEQAMERVISSVENISESSNKIGSIIRVIDEIAFQTNLLALNAAVEAARAGESGRGFSVVAGEVRDLAGRSANAAKEIKSLVTEIIDRVKIGTEVAVDSGDVLKGVINSFQKVNEEVIHIGQSIEDQANSISEVAIAMKTIESNTQATAAVTEETAASSEMMASQASSLRGMTGAFKV